MLERTKLWVKVHKGAITIVGCTVAGAVAGGLGAMYGYHMGFNDGARYVSHNLGTTFMDLISRLGESGHCSTLDWLEEYAPDAYAAAIDALNSAHYATTHTVAQLFDEKCDVKEAYRLCEALIKKGE